MDLDAALGVALERRTAATAPPSRIAGSTRAFWIAPSATRVDAVGHDGRGSRRDIVAAAHDDVGAEVAHERLVGLRRVGDTRRPSALASCTT